MPGLTITPILPASRTSWSGGNTSLSASSGIETLPTGLYNLAVFFILILLASWAAKIAHCVSLSVEIKKKLDSDGNILRLNGLSVYRRDLQRLLRSHLNQLLRLRRTVPNQPLQRWQVGVAVVPDSVKVSVAEAAAGGVTISSSGRRRRLYDVEVNCQLCINKGQTKRMRVHVGRGRFWNWVDLVEVGYILELNSWLYHFDSSPAILRVSGGFCGWGKCAGIGLVAVTSADVWSFGEY